MSRSSLWTSRHVRFNETQYPFAKLLHKQPQSPTETTSTPAYPPYTTVPFRQSLIQSPASSRKNQLPSSDSSPSPSPAPEPSATWTPVNNDPPIPTTNDTSASQTVADTDPASVTETATVSPTHAGPRHPMTTRSRNNIVKPVTSYNYSATVQSDPHWIPSTWQQAIKHEHWRKAMSSEFTSTSYNHTWDLVEVTARINVVGCRWVFLIKYHVDGSIDKYKAKIVATGFHQQQGVEYMYTFSPVIKATTIRLVLGLAANRDWPVRQIDVNTAFLQGQLKEEVFMSQPQGFSDPNRPSHVCHLKKAIYGLKQAPRAWYSELRSFLIQAGFQNPLSDASLFILHHQRKFIYVLFYVDDILVTGSDPMLIQRVITSLENLFSIKDMGNLSYFLGTETIRTPRGIHLMQRKYITYLLVKANMLNAKPVAMPLPTHPKPTQNSSSALSDPHEYRKLVGSLQHLSITRPDISYAVNRLSQFMHRPTIDHWQATKRVLRYLSGTLNHGIFQQKQSTPTLHAYSDADWACDSDDYVSTNAYIIYMGSTLV